MNNHPAVIWFNENSDDKSTGIEINNFDYQTLKDMAICAGADDCGIANIVSTALQDEKKEILSIYPETKAVMSIVIKLNRENVRCVSRSVSDLEFLQGFEAANSVARKLTALLKAL